MSSKNRQHVLGIALASLIILVILLIAVLWTGLRNGFFARQQIPAELRLKVNAINQSTTESEVNLTTEQPKCEYVRPVKISPLELHEDDLLYGSDQLGGEVPLRHHSGHYRHKTAHVWDPHPIYQFSAFKRTFMLVLEHDTEFAPPDLQVTHVWGNTSSRFGGKLKYSGCFYRGHMDGDIKSLVYVSLCHGITGHIRMSTGSYYINPIEDKAAEDHMTPALHIICDYPPRKGNSCGMIDDVQPKRLRDHHHGLLPDDEFEFLDDSTNSSKRSKRSVLREYFVELMVVADKSMVDYHGPENVESYILALLYIVAGIFKDASIGNPITISVVKIQILDTYTFVKYRNARHGGVSATDMLSEFCRYQSHSPVNHDTALLLTRENICRDLAEDKCETLGLAELGTICDSQGSCSIVQDNGLSAAFTIAHELGHVLNMPHDGETYCKQYTNTHSHSHVMSNSHHEGTNPWQWSECSRHIVTEFLESKHGECLRNRPRRDDLGERSNLALPGEQIMANQQCQLLYGRGSTICTYMPVCRELWCTKPGGEACQTLHMPWSDGTPCAPGRWCQKGTCVTRDPDKLKKVDGQWGPWEDFGPCSRSCGGGIKRSVRQCNNPRPENGGKYCVGTRVRYESCETQDCSPNAKDFRHVQCSRFDSNNRGIPGLSPNVRWLPKYGLSGDDRCSLYCRAYNTNSYFSLKDKVIDGTPCSPESYDVCVNGQCQPAGCDRILYSGMQLDICGKCGGMNDTCRLVQGYFNESAQAEGYRVVVVIPAGASNLDIQQHGTNSRRDDNYLALTQANSGEGLLNNDYVLATSRKIIAFEGITLEYSGWDVPSERINASRPLKKDLQVEVLSVGLLSGPDITYQYTIPHYNEDRYMWKHVEEWTDCDRLCNGKKIRLIACYTDTNEVINESYCSNSFKAKLAPMVAACNTNCDLNWRITGKSECSSHCGPGTRTVTKECVQIMKNQEVYTYDSKFCMHLPNTPPDVEKCEGPCDAAHWKYTEWSQCSRTCGTGIQQRDAICVDDLDRPKHPEKCSRQEKVIQRRCDLGKCPTYVYGNWSSCSVTCGKGTRRRQHWCQKNNQIVETALCGSEPIVEELCEMRICTRWSKSTWSQCSNACGVGVQTRTVNCVTNDGYPVPDDQCLETKPTDRQNCNTLHTCNHYVVYHADDRENRIDFDLAWIAEPWSQCSVTCGGGTQYRRVYCPGRYHDPSSSSPCRGMKPPTTMACGEVPCPVSGQWIIKEWSPCSETCGLGIKQRQVLCHSADGIFLHDRDCSEPKPQSQTTCTIRSCQIFKWRKGKWTPCSEMCGIGTKSRVFHCIDESSGKRVADSYCNHLLPPKKKVVPCLRKLCPFTWKEGPWSECSTSCDKGTQTRNVTCHAVNDYQWLDPEPIATDYTPCDVSHRPSTTQSCLLRNCSATHYWKYDGWTQCSKTCGTKGMQHSKLSCWDARGRKVDKSHCRRLSRPTKLRQLCNLRPCNSVTCKEVQQKTNARADGNYQLLVGGVNVTIYCKNMNTTNPIEFLPLAVPDENFSWYSLIPSHHCPTDGFPQAFHKIQSLTAFKRVRLDVERLVIYTNDFSFTHMMRGNSTPLGELGSEHCFPIRSHYTRSIGSNTCLQGRFSINLQRSPFRIAHNQKWHSTAYSVFKIDRKDSQTILGYCNGLCGHCRPATKNMIKVQALPP